MERVEREGRKAAGVEVDERGDDEGGGEGESGIGVDIRDVERGGRRKGREELKLRAHQMGMISYHP